MPDYAALDATLQPGDVIYIHNHVGVIGHAVMWLGAIGRSPDSDPLIIDCTQTGHRDAKGVDIPLGVRIRPFRRNGWYFRQASHVHRILHAGSPVCRTTPAPFPEGGDPRLTIADRQRFWLFATRSVAGSSRVLSRRGGRVFPRPGA